MKYPLNLALAAALVFSAPLCVTAEEGVLVPIDRPEKAGTTANLAIEAEQSMKMSITAGGQALQDEAQGWKASIEMTRTTNKVDEKGKPTELTLKIKKFSVTRDGETSEELEAGTVVKATSEDGEKSFTVEDEEVEPEVMEVLDMVLDIGGEEKGDENKAFGVDKPRKAGEEWDVNVDELIATMPDGIPFVLKKDATKGKMKLVEITGSGSDKTATLSGTVDMVVEGMKEMPPGTEINASSLKVSLEGDFPLDATRQPVREAMSMTVDFSGKIPMPDGNKAEMKMDVSMKKKSKVVP
jgi:hypothetical protein